MWKTFALPVFCRTRHRQPAQLLGHCPFCVCQLFSDDMNKRNIELVIYNLWDLHWCVVSFDSVLNDYNCGHSERAVWKIKSISKTIYSWLRLLKAGTNLPVGLTGAPSVPSLRILWNVILKGLVKNFWLVRIVYRARKSSRGGSRILRKGRREFFLQIHAPVWRLCGRIFMLLWFLVFFEFEIILLFLFFAVCSDSLWK